jgi:hypothetical protein
MKPRHAAALALVGWYLLAPPLRGRNAIDMSAPIAKWDHWGASAFESERDCQNLQYQVAMLAEFRSGPNLQRLKASTCVKTDDPRLKSN